MKTVVVFGPPACGKTRNAEALAAHFGVNIVVDDWDPKHHRLTPGALHLGHQGYDGPEARSFAFSLLTFAPEARTTISRRKARSKKWSCADPYGEAA